MSNNKSLVSQIESSDSKSGTYATGIFYSVMNGASLGSMFIVQKLAQDQSNFNLVHMLLVRQLVVLIFSYVHAKMEGYKLGWFGYGLFKSYSKKTRQLVMLRCTLDFVSGVFLTLGIQLMPVSQSVSLSRLTVFFTPILA